MLRWSGRGCLAESERWQLPARDLLGLGDSLLEGPIVLDEQADIEDEEH
jgi:hypothetical protein